MRAANSYALRFSTANLRELYITKTGIDPTPGLDKVSSPKFAEALDENIEIILRKATNKTYRCTNYRQKLLSKGGNCNPREICIPTIRDKLMLGALAQILDDVYGPECATPHPQRVIGDIRSQILSGSFDAFIKVDITSFYASIKHDKLMTIVRRRIRKLEILHLIETAIRTPSSTYRTKATSVRKKGVPEGLSISNKLANLYVSDIDRAFSKRIDCAYYRYVDDILILCKESDVESIESSIRKAIQRLTLAPNKEKCKSGLLKSHEFGYLGYTFQPNSTLTVRHSSILNIEHAIESIFRQFSEDQSKYFYWKLNLRITGCRIENDDGLIERYGWLHYFSRIDDIELLHHLDWLVGKFFDKYSRNKPEYLKTFVRTYYEMNYNASSTRYIPTWSPKTPIDEKRRMLTEVFNGINVEEMNDSEVTRLFNERIRKEARRLERDIGRLSC